MLLWVEVDVLQGTVIDLVMHLVNELELIPLELVTAEPGDRVVLFDQLHDHLGHLLVAFDVVRHAERSQSMHFCQFVLKSVEGILERVNEVLEGRALPPVGDLEDLQDVANIVNLVQSLIICVRVELEDVTDLGKVLNVFLSEGCLAEFRVLLYSVHLSEVLQVHTRLHQVDDRCHGFQLDLGEDRIGGLDVLHVLLFEILQLGNHFFLPTHEGACLKVIAIVALLDVADDVHELFLAVEMVLVGRVGHLPLDLIDLDVVSLHTFEHHRAENGLLVGCNKSKARVIS